MVNLFNRILCEHNLIILTGKEYCGCAVEISQSIDVI